MRYRGHFSHQETSVNAYGERVLAYGAIYLTAWLRRVRTGGSEGMQDQRIEATVTEVFEMRYDSRVLLTDKVTIGSSVYNITQADDTYKHKGKLVLTLRRND